MTGNPFEIAMIILLIAGFPLIVWMQGRVTELMASGEEARVPGPLKLLANGKYLESIYEGEVEYQASHRWKIFVAVIGLVIPAIMLLTATDQNFVLGLVLILASVVVFFVGIAVLEWLFRPK